MKCLNCGEPMVALELRGFEVDCCLACGGIWLDSDELEALLNSGMPERLLNTDLAASKSRRKCPVCSRKMSTANAGPLKATEIDSCAQGHGLWFDRGELETVAMSLEEPLGSKVVEELRAIFSQR